MIFMRKYNDPRRKSTRGLDLKHLKTYSDKWQTFVRTKLRGGEFAQAMFNRLSKT